MQFNQNNRLSILLLCATVALASTTAAAQQQKPDILLIVADNVGYGDVGAYGGGEPRGAPTRVAVENSKHFRI